MMHGTVNIKCDKDIIKDA